jgi:hypothetical protein
MRTCRAAVLVLLPLALSGCRRKPGLAPVELPPLGALPAEQVVANLAKAHYDAVDLGLRELAFELDLDYPQVKTRVQGTGTWRTGQPVSVTVKGVERNGKTETKPSDPGMSNQVWTAAQLQAEQLLEGLGRSFLHNRLEEWRKVQGKTRMEGDKLALSFSEPTGEKVVTVSQGWAVDKVEDHSTKKVTRWMEYRHRTEKGRHLITSARMHVVVDPASGLPPGEVKILSSQEGLTFAIEYQESGGYLLPGLLRKTSSRGEEALLKLRYTTVK